MIVEMRKLNLVAMSYERDAILNALHKSNVAEMKWQTEEAETVPVQADAEPLREYHASLVNTLETLVQEAESYAKEHKQKLSLPKDGFEVSYEQFMNAASDRDRADTLMREVGAMSDERNECKAKLTKLTREIGAAQAYRTLTKPFSYFSETAHTRTVLGTIARRTIIETVLPPLAAVEWLDDGEETVLVAVICHKSVAEECDHILSEAGFSVCPYGGEETGEEFVSRLEAESASLTERIETLEKKFFELSDQVGMLKIYCDYVAFELEKAEQSAKLRATERTILLEAFVPKGSEEKIREALSSVSVVYFTFSDLKEGEECPTFYKNNAVVSNFEAITESYDVPNARELDPTTVMAFFYSVFLGFIMADIGYGLVMMLAGGLICYKQRGRKSGLKSLAGAFAVGGIFSVIWGVLFNSIFGFTLPIPTVMPNAQKDMWGFAGVRIPSILIIAMIIGIIQLMTGYLCCAAQRWRRGQILDGIFDGGVWALFSLGVGIAFVGLVEEFHLSSLVPVGGILAAASLVVAVLTAGRKEKIVGKFTKGFGALYSVINYASDVLSYARLYGLMLSGAVIAQVVASYATTFFEAGGFLIIVAILLLIIGNAFNLAMGLLSAYIHDSRLQYVEFYGKFLEGGGWAFTPLGSRHQFVYVKSPEPQKETGTQKAAVAA